MNMPFHASFVRRNQILSEGLYFLLEVGFDWESHANLNFLHQVTLIKPDGMPLSKITNLQVVNEPNITMNTSIEERHPSKLLQNSLVGERKILFEDGVVLMTQEERFSDEIIEFLDRATWGTEGALFKHTDTAGRIDDLLHPLFIVLRIRDQVAATVVMERRRLYHGDLQTESFFVRYYASQVNFRDRRLVGLYSHKFIKYLREIDRDKSVYYASIEKKNHRSININLKMGYRAIAEIKTIGFSRFFPRQQVEVQHAKDVDLTFILEKLRKKYHGYSLFHSSYIGHKQQYYVFKNEGEIVAGVQVHHARWIVANLPGRVGALLVKMAGYIPLFRRLFNPKDWHFLGVEGIYIAAGHEDKFCKLLEGVLAIENANAAMIWLDKKSPDFKTISGLSNLGLINRFTGRI